MFRFHVRMVSLGAGVAGLSLLLAAVSGGPTNADISPHVSPMVAQRAHPARVLRAFPAPAQQLAHGRQRYAVPAASPCAASTATPYFIGISGQSDIAGGDAAVAGGSGNEACDEYDGILAGTGNVIGASGSADHSVIGGGAYNNIRGEYSFVGAGYENNVAGDHSFVGAGDYVAAAGLGSFVGGGGTEYDLKTSGGRCYGCGNFAEGQDSFIGGGDINQIGYGGSGSFIGGGGYDASSSEFSNSNLITSEDSFIGAGDSNQAEGNESFVGSGSANLSSGPNAFVGGGLSNMSSGSASFVGGGSYNESSGAGTFVGSGTTNQNSGPEAIIGAGAYNTISTSASYASILGGNGNTASGEYSSIDGGNGNTASGEFSLVVGGNDNKAQGAFGVVAGGADNQAQGVTSFAAGYHADAVHGGSFVWSDETSGSSLVSDGAANEFVVRASGGTYVYSSENLASGVKLAAGSGTWASLSDRNAKTDIVPLDDASVLSKVASLPVSTWRYKTERGVRHVGPMAQDFYTAFGVGEDDRHITSIDEDGVAIAAIKALHTENARLRGDDTRLRGVVARNDRELHAQISHLQSSLIALEAKVEELTSIHRHR